MNLKKSYYQFNCQKLNKNYNKLILNNAAIVYFTKKIPKILRILITDIQIFT